MKNILYVLLVTLVFTSCQKEKKIGFIDNGVVINDYQEKKDLEAKFQIKEEAFRKKFDSIDQVFKLEVQQFQNSAKKMSQSKAQEKYQELGQKQQFLEQQKQVEAQQFQKAFQTQIDTVIVKVKDFVKDYGKKNGYTYILGTSDAAANVLYGTDENDLTKTILDALNEAYKK
ncbi:OmpH family outer membrane protein [Flavivirga spongiicola]|uniref:OmpH family outer membrane protein n=1 Tax=Flavivirga spongiicola TaxID=421621 RepID=A0ABU7XTL4_9FLAO|nr:OmpH family outer membrane protein [Flavivirga sp. MEBiC05379]MDO5978916.1 OmpH family outer membrane protein [Flavivirga sp. MEBiC05379]